MVQWLIETTDLCLQINILHCEKNWLILLPLVGITAGRKVGSQGGRQAGTQNMGGSQNFSNSVKVKIFGLILFVITAMLLQY